jgi:aryl-alcohol dehydrogenase-like predicted oxidoreductase
MESHDEHARRHRLTRRAFLRDATVATAVAAMPSAAFGADPAPKPDGGALLMRAIPSTGERLPMVGLGTNAYGVTDPAEIARRRDVVARLVQLGAKLVDTARAYGDSELVVGRLLRELNARDRVFLASKTPNNGDLGKPDEIVAETFRRLGTDKVDLLQIHSMHGVAELLPTLRKLKEERRVRYVGATTSSDDQYPQLLAAMRAHSLDFIQVDYSIDNRNAATEVLPLAQARGMGVLVNMPFGGRREGNLLRKLGERPLPAWAGELSASTWAEVLLKYVLSHPAVTCAIPGTTSVANLETNVRAARGALPDASLRKRMEADWDALAV